MAKHHLEICFYWFQFQTGDPSKLADLFECREDRDLLLEELRINPELCKDIAKALRNQAPQRGRPKKLREYRDEELLYVLWCYRGYGLPFYYSSTPKPVEKTAEGAALESFCKEFGHPGITAGGLAQLRQRVFRNPFMKWHAASGFCSGANDGLGSTNDKEKFIKQALKRAERSKLQIIFEDGKFTHHDKYPAFTIEPE